MIFMMLYSCDIGLVAKSWPSQTVQIGRCCHGTCANLSPKF